MSARDEIEGLRVPPHSLEAEQAVLGALLLDNRGWDRCADVVSAADFYTFAYGVVFQAIGALILGSKPADVVTVFDQLRRTGSDQHCDMAHLNALASGAPGASGIRQYAEIVRGHALHRRLISTANDALTAAWVGADVTSTLDQITSMFGELQGRQVRRLPRLVGDVALERVDHYTALADGSIEPGWRTHIPWLDEAIGGFHPGDLVTLAARPGVGKSGFSLAIATNVARDGHPAAVLSMEMTDAEIADRAVASTGRVSSKALKTGRLAPEDWSRIAEAAERLAGLPLYVDDQPALTLRDIRIKAKAIKGLRLLVVDYLQLSVGGRRDGNRNAEIEELTRGLKSLAKELGIAILALSQLNRDVEKRQIKRPMLSDLRDSGGIEQDSDVVLFLWNVRELPIEGRRIVGLGVDKNRNGPLGEVGLDFYGDTQRWGESTADIRPSTAQRGGDL